MESLASSEAHLAISKSMEDARPEARTPELLMVEMMVGSSPRERFSSWSVMDMVGRGRFWWD